MHAGGREFDSPWLQIILISLRFIKMISIDRLVSVKSLARVKKWFFNNLANSTTHAYIARFNLKFC